MKISLKILSSRRSKEDRLKVSSSPAAALVHIRTPEAKEGERMPFSGGDDYGGDDWQHRSREEDDRSPSDHRDEVHF